MRIAGIIDRGDRKPLSDFVTNRIRPQVDQFITTDHIPIVDENTHDIVPRAKYIWERARGLGADVLYFVENDDYYPHDYIAKMESRRAGRDFININSYLMYHIHDRNYTAISHRDKGFKIGGLWTMGLRPEILDNFIWPDHNERKLDTIICKFIQGQEFSNVWTDGVTMECLSIKGHGHGYRNPSDSSFHARLREPIYPDWDGSALLYLTLMDYGFYDLHYQDEYRPTPSQVMDRIKEQRNKDPKTPDLFIAKQSIRAVNEFDIQYRQI